LVPYILRRLLRAVILLLLVSLIIFFAMRLLPGDPIYMIMNQGQISNATQEQIQAIREEYGLDKSLVTQYIVWLGGIFRGEFGTSIAYHTSPLTILARTIPITLNISIPAFLISLLIGIPAGIICAIRRATWVDTIVTVLANIGITIPVFWLGTILIYVFALRFDLLPVEGYTSPFTDFGKNLSQLVMPIFCQAIFPISAIARQTRSSMLEVMRQDYMRTAWSKGLGEKIVVMRHALKNSLIPVVVLSGLFFSGILGGSVLVETVFNIRGAGLAMVSAVFSRDYPVVQAFSLIIAVFTLLVNLIVDISYGWIDPRIRYG
jgi:peptide/nickel transport system permease protein